MPKKMTVIIFSCRHQKELFARTYKAMSWALKNEIEPVVIITGNDAQSVISTLKNNKIIWEYKSTTTEENARNVLEIIDRYRINNLERVWVSSWYHVARIKLLLWRAGVNVKHETFVKSYSGIQVINILIEPFALLAAFFRINHWPAITYIKRLLGYNV